MDIWIKNGSLVLKNNTLVVCNDCPCDNCGDYPSSLLVTATSAPFWQPSVVFLSPARGTACMALDAGCYWVGTAVGPGICAGTIITVAGPNLSGVWGICSGLTCMAAQQNPVNIATPVGTYTNGIVIT